MKRQYLVMIGATFMLILGLLIGMSHPAIGLSFLGTSTCSSSSPCDGGSNTSSGAGVRGQSSQGRGVQGEASFNSTLASNGQQGVLGADTSSSGQYSEGVRGTSTRGIAIHGISTVRDGVLAESLGTTYGGRGLVANTYGTGTAVLGQATSGLGVQASSLNGGGAFIAGRSGIEVTDNGSGGSAADVIFANGRGGTLFRGNNSTSQDVFVVNDAGLATMKQVQSGATDVATALDSAGNTIGVQGRIVGTTFPEAGVQGVNSTDVNSIAVRASGFGGKLFVGNNSLSKDVFTVDDSGNAFFAGSVSAGSYVTHAAPIVVQQTHSGSSVSTFASESTSPNIEDFGEARLYGGSAYVPLDSHFASAIDRRYPYLVFITAQGATRGPVDVVQKNSQGFYVREAGGTSSVAFDYRIVARPYVQSQSSPSTGIVQQRPKTLPRAPKIRTVRTKKYGPIAPPRRR